MPFYEYTCPKCETRFDLMRTISDRDLPAPCPGCGFEQVRRELPHVQACVKGSGRSEGNLPPCGRSDGFS